MAVVWTIPVGASAQTRAAASTAAGADGDAATTLAGAALGTASLGLVSTVAALVPCGRDEAGRECVRLFASGGGALGLAAGATVGQQGGDALEPIARGAAIGLLAGALAGLGLRAVLDRSRWLDVLAVAVLGGAIGAAPAGSAIGLAAGGAVGLLLWQAIPDFTLPDAVGSALAGLAAGAVLQWFDRATDDPRGGPALAFRVPLGANR